MEGKAQKEEHFAEARTWAGWGSEGRWVDARWPWSLGSPEATWAQKPGGLPLRLVGGRLCAASISVIWAQEVRPRGQEALQG